MNKRIQDAISRFGEEACIMAYDYNVNQGEGGTFIEANTGIPKRSQGAAIAAGEYLVKQRGMKNPASRREKYDDFDEWERDVFRAGATQVLEVGENIFYAIRTPDNKRVQSDADGMFDLRSRRGREVMKTAKTIGGWAGGSGEIYRHLVARAGKARPYENPVHRSKESPLYVKYLSLKADEEPFMMGGTKYEYVWAEYPGGIKDIGVYSYANDLVYSYDSFRQMMNLPNPYRPRKGEPSRAFIKRCMSDEKERFPEPKQRIAVCLSKSRKRNPVYDTGSDE